MVLTATLFDRLTRECESHPLSFLVVMIDDQVVAPGLTREISVNQLFSEQFLADRLRLYLGELRIDGFFEDLLVFFGRLLSLLELPLPLESRGLVDVGEDLRQVGDLDDFGAVERSF